MELDKSAPISHSGSIAVNAPVDRVWRLMSDINHWPEWNTQITAANLDGELKPGTVFVWKSGPGTIVSTLQAVEPNRLLAWSGRTMGIKAVHIWRFEMRDGQTVVTTEESWDGLPARLFKGYSRKTLAKAIDSGLQLLKTAAEKS